MLPIVTSSGPPGVTSPLVSTIRARVAGASPAASFLTCAVTVIVSPHVTLPGVTPSEVPIRFAGVCWAIVTTEVSTPLAMPSLFISSDSATFPKGSTRRLM